MRDLINLVENIVSEGRTYDIDTGYNGVSRMTRVYMNPVPEQGATLAKASMLNGLLYIRGILVDGKRLYAANGGSLTHHDLIQEFCPGMEERDSRITTFEVVNYRMNGPKPTMTEARLFTAKPGDHNVETNPLALKLLEGCKSVCGEPMNEAPIGDWTVDHAFDDNEREMVGQFKGYSREQKHWSDPDKKVIRDPGSIEHVRNGFKNTSATFNLYFYQANDPDYDIFMQKGVVDLDWVKQRMGEKSAAAVAQSVRPGQITVIMTNNLSDESWISIRSPWMVAHRMAHTLITGESRLEASWKVMEIFDKFVRDISSHGYGVKWPRGDDYHSTLFRKDYYEAYRKVLGHALGTMRSTRAKKLTQDTEWYMETFAQYLMTGRVKLYTLPKEIHPDEQLTSDPVKLAKVQKAWEEFPVRITKAFDRLLKDAEGKIWVM